MNIAIVGYGKMGKTIEKIALERGHQISLKIDSSNADSFNAASLHDTDVAIEFSHPDSAFHNLKICADSKTNTVSGTTGWLDHKEEVDTAFAECESAFLYASNFSVGVNLFFEINKKLAQIISGHDGYSALVEETHHIHKKDAPSGTALSLVKDILEENPQYDSWTLDTPTKDGELKIDAHRVEEVFGDHIVAYESDIDIIKISHQAKSRKGFALGAVLAAEWIKDKQGIYSMKDVLGIT